MKKSLFGYKKADVHARLTELQETIKMSESRIASLEEKFAQAQKTLQEKNIALDNMSNELNRYILQATQAEKNEAPAVSGGRQKPRQRGRNLYAGLRQRLVDNQIGPKKCRGFHGQGICPVGQRRGAGQKGYLQHAAYEERFAEHGRQHNG